MGNMASAVDTGASKTMEEKKTAFEQIAIKKKVLFEEYLELSSKPTLNTQIEEVTNQHKAKFLEFENLIKTQRKGNDDLTELKADASLSDSGDEDDLYVKRKAEDEKNAKKWAAALNKKLGELAKADGQCAERKVELLKKLKSCYTGEFEFFKKYGGGLELAVVDLSQRDAELIKAKTESENLSSALRDEKSIHENTKEKLSKALTREASLEEELKKIKAEIIVALVPAEAPDKTLLSSSNERAEKNSASVSSSPANSTPCNTSEPSKASSNEALMKANTRIIQLEKANGDLKTRNNTLSKSLAGKTAAITSATEKIAKLETQITLQAPLVKVGNDVRDGFLEKANEVLSATGVYKVVRRKVDITVVLTKNIASHHGNWAADRARFNLLSMAGKLTQEQQDHFVYVYGLPVQEKLLSMKVVEAVDMHGTMIACGMGTEHTINKNKDAQFKQLYAALSKSYKDATKGNLSSDEMVKKFHATYGLDSNIREMKRIMEQTTKVYRYRLQKYKS